MTYVALACQFALVLVFAVSSGTKLRGRSAYSAFRESLRRLTWLPGALVGPAAALTVAAEVAIVVMLVVPPWTPAGFGVAAALLTVFSGGIAASRRRGVRATCRCFGTSSRPLGWAHVARNLALVAVAGIGVAAHLAAGASTSLHPGGVTVAAVAGLAVGGLGVVFDDLVELFAPSTVHPSGATTPKAS